MFARASARGAFFAFAIGGIMVVSTLPGAAEDRVVSSSVAPSKWSPWFEFGGYYGTDNSTRGEGALWAPLTQGHNSLLFGEIRAKQFEESLREGNFALGYRQMMAEGWNFGIWGGYDMRRSPYGNLFHQLAGGIELLSDRWDFRANAYVPLNDRENVATTSTIVSSAATVEMIGSQLVMTGTADVLTSRLDELGLWGFDGEIGAKLFATNEALPGPRHEFRVYAGAFHFDHSDLEHSVTGPRVRAEWRIDDLVDGWRGSRLTIEGEYSHDKLRDDRFEIGARLRLPLGQDAAPVEAAYALTAQERRMTEGLERDTDVVTSANTSSRTKTRRLGSEVVEDAETGVRFDRVVVVDATGNLTSASTTAGANSLIIADGAAGNLTGNHGLQGDQTLLGGGGTIKVRGVTSGIVVDFTASGVRPMLTAAGGNVVTLAGNNTHVASLDVNGGVNGIYADSRSNTVLTRLNISNPVWDGVRLDGAGGSTRISHTVISGAGDDVIQIAASGHSLTIANSTLRDSSYGFYNTGTNTTLVVDNVSFVNLRSWAIYQASGEIALNNSTISGGSIGYLLYLGGPNSIGGAGNTATGSTYSGMCVSSIPWTGSVEFDGVSYTSADCH